MELLLKSGIKYYRKNFLQLVLSIVGIALGVAVVIAIDLANSSAIRAFDISMQSVSGKSTHQISSSFLLNDTLLSYIRSNSPKFIKTAPVVEKFVRINYPQRSTFTFLGIDPFSERYFRNYLSINNSDLLSIIGNVIYKPKSIFINEITANNFNLKIGDSLNIETDGKFYTVYIAGLLKFDNDYDNELSKNILISDISVAQDLFGINSQISRIDLILNNEDIELIKNLLPNGVILSSSQARSKAGQNMTESFRINLTAMSLLSLIVGMFLIYNTMTFSVVQRRRLIGLLRSLGVTREEIFRLVLFESSFIGIIGTFLGIISGIFLGEFLINLVTKTINDMYFVLQVKDVYISEITLVKGLILGLLATMFSALKPAYDASKVPPGIALIRSYDETTLQKKSKNYFFVGLILIVIGFIVLKLPSKNIYYSYIGVVPFFVGFALITPYSLIIFVNFVNKYVYKIFGSIGKLAARGITENLSKTTIAVAALSIALSAAIGIGTMVSSFRQTVIDWLNYKLKADIYASVPTNVSRFNDGTFEEWVVDSARSIDGIKAINLYRENQINYNGKIFHILAMKVQSFDNETFKEQIADKDKLWELFNKGDYAIISESYSYKNNMHAGDTLFIPTDKGIKPFPIIAVFYDYSSDIGLIFINLINYRKYFEDRLYSGIGLFVKDKNKVDEFAKNLENKINEKINFIVRTNSKLIESSIEVFDRTFLITNVLQILAIIVSFIGILSALMALQLEKSRQFAIFRANGLLSGQLWQYVIIQTGLMGLISGLFAIPLGNILAYILIDVINTRSFGWSIDFYFMPSFLFQALFVGISSAILAGLYPAFIMSKTPPALSLRNE